MILNILLVVTGLIAVGDWVLAKITKREYQVSETIELIRFIFVLLVFIKLAIVIGIEIVLVTITIASGIGWVIHFIQKRRLQAQASSTDDNQQPQYRKSLLLDYSQSFFPILLIVLLLRSFVGEPFRIPTGSLKPTLLDGDFILVNKYIYGLRLPVTHSQVLPIDKPQVGDIVVFRWPVNPKVDFIKRVIGVPGDHIQYSNKILYRNGKPVPQEFEADVTMRDDNGQQHHVIRKRELLDKMIHQIYLRPDIADIANIDITVPPGHYFMMGDNRDGSFDSRGWGFVPEQNIIGKAVLIWLSWDQYAQQLSQKIRWERVGKFINNRENKYEKG
ncbi:MAG: signal peptidase I [Gammaproteobacteria bacterium]